LVTKRPGQPRLSGSKMAPFKRLAGPIASREGVKLRLLLFFVLRVQEPMIFLKVVRRPEKLVASTTALWSSCIIVSVSSVQMAELSTLTLLIVSVMQKLWSRLRSVLQREISKYGGATAT
jgi:hypothetical protein